MSVAGQTSITYGYDNANRLTQIQQGSSATVTIAPDADSRRQSVTLPNGVSMNYGYDVASQLTGITYKLGANTLGNLTYGYDLAGRRTAVGGSYARTNVPAAASAASYNVNNQLTNWKGATLTYDLNGNLTSDGTNTYTWNARNQLVTISGVVNANFQYDAFGRRVSKNINGTTQFLYDGANPVQEISGSSTPTNLLTGRVDEYFQRTDSAGARSFLTDALGSTLALADSTGTLQTSYTFEPFGNTSTTGATTTNSFAFTGREFDASSLYYYRARYYGPSFQRFVSEDPLGFSSGANLYSYSANSPTQLVDPFGLTWENFWNNPIMDFLSEHANWLPGACQGGVFAGGGVQSAGKTGGGLFGLGDLSYSPQTGWTTGGGILPEAFSEVNHTPIGGGAVLPNGEVLVYALPYERMLPGGFSAGMGPVYAANMRNYDGISIGWVGDISTPNPTGMGAQGSGFVGAYLTFTNASTCLEKMLRGRNSHSH